MHLLVSSQVLKQLRPILRAGATIFRRKHCLRRFDIRQGAASFRPPKAQEAPSYRLISGRRKGVEKQSNRSATRPTHAYHCKVGGLIDFYDKTKFRPIEFHRALDVCDAQSEPFQSNVSHGQHILYVG
jgi:hypothetical protein